MSENTPFYKTKFVSATLNSQPDTRNPEPVTNNQQPGTSTEPDTAILIEGLQSIITKADNITFSNMSVTAQSIKSIACFLTDILKQKM